MRRRAISDSLLATKGYGAIVDVLVHMEWLHPKDLENWRFRRVSYLERVIRCNTPRLNQTLKELRVHWRAQGLRPSWTAQPECGACH